MSNKDDYPIEMWRGLVCLSGTLQAFIRQEVLPGLDDLTPDHIVNFLEKEKVDETCAESDRSVLRFMLRVWDYTKYDFDYSEITLWGWKDIEMFSKWLTDPMMPCEVFVPEKHNQSIGEGWNRIDPKFENVELGWQKSLG